MALVEIDERSCSGCGACVAACGSAIIAPRAKGPPRLFPGAEAFCLRCGHCVAVCPTGSLSHREMPPESLEAVDVELKPSFEQVSRLVRSRRSVREFREEAPPRELLERIIDVARYAPTGHNAQELTWLVFAGREETRRLTAVGMDWADSMAGAGTPLAAQLQGILRMREYGADLFLRDAPALVLACADPAVPTALTDCAIAGAYFDLAAKAAGLGCFWNGYLVACARSFAPMAGALGLPEGLEPLAALCLGYPRFEYRRIPPRRAAQAVFRP